MSDRRDDEPAQLLAMRNSAELIELLRARVAWIGLVVAGSALMGLATLEGPAAVSAGFGLAGDPTLVPLPADDSCGQVSVPALATTVSLPNLPALTTCSSTHASSLTSEQEQSSAIKTSSESSISPPASTHTNSRFSITTARSGSTSTASSSKSKTAAGVLGADTGTPSTGTDIAFGIGIGLVIAGAGIGTGTGAFLKRRRTTK